MCCSRCSDGEFYWSGCKCPCHLPETPMTHTPIPKQEDVPEAARKAFTCFHDFKPVDPLDTTSIAVYCHKCGTTVEGNEIIPPVAYSLGTDKGELPEEWEKKIQTGYEKLIAIIHEAHDNGLISGRLYKKFGDTFNEIVRSHLNSRELPPAIGVSQVIKMVEGMKQECVPDGDNDDLRPYNQALDEVISKLKK